jgi:hypothetical protein
VEEVVGGRCSSISGANVGDGGRRQVDGEQRQGRRTMRGGLGSSGGHVSLYSCGAGKILASGGHPALTILKLTLTTNFIQ